MGVDITEFRVYKSMITHCTPNANTRGVESGNFVLERSNSLALLCVPHVDSIQAS